MAKHLPPPKNKHLSSEPSKHQIKKEAIKNVWERDILSEHKLSVRSVVSCALALVLLVAIGYFPIEGLLQTFFYLIPLILSSVGVAARLALKLSQRDYYEEDIIILLAAYITFFLGYHITATLVMLLYRLGELACDFAVTRCRNKTSEISSGTVRKVNVLKNGKVYSVRPEQLRPGNILIVSKGELIPFDGVLVEGVSSIDTALISGSHKHINVAPGSKILSGSINLSRDIKIKISRSYSKSVYTVIVDNLLDRNRKKAKQELFVSRFARIYTPVAVIAAIILSVIPPLFYGQWQDWISRGVVVLLLSCPCALTISVPLTFISGLLRAAFSGIHIKDDNVFEELSRSEIVVFDKTGTITDGNYVVSGVYPKGVSEEQLIQAAAEAERYSDHPVARTIKQMYPLKPLEENAVYEAEEIHGKGVIAFLNKHHIYVGNPTLLQDHGIRYSIPTRPGAAIHVAVDGVYWGYIQVSDKVKSGAFDALEAMRRQGVRNMVLLTGDVRSVSRTLASSLNFDMVKSELVPESKVSAVEYLMATKGDRSTLGYVGDAENDREALSRADVGIALGALSSVDPFRNSDVVIMSEELSKLPEMLEISRTGIRIVNLNIMFTLASKLILIILAAFGLVPIWLASVVEAVDMIFCMLNTSLMFKFEKRSKKND